MAGRRKVIILGALSAVAEETARLFAADGGEILLVGRQKERLERVAADLRERGAARVETAELDLAGADPARETSRLVTAIGGVDVMLLAYGELGDQALAERDLAHAAHILDTDFRSASLWCLAFAAEFERLKKGTMLVIGSVAGDRGRGSNYIYGAAKAGLGVLVQGLAHRLARSNARAVLIKPGFIDTPMTAAFKKGPLWAKPKSIAAIIRGAADRGGPIVYAPGFWRLIMLGVRLTPAALMHRTRL